VLDCTIDRVRHLLRRRILKGRKLGGEWIVESQSIRSLAQTSGGGAMLTPHAARPEPIDSAALMLTAEQACRMLNVSRPTLYRLIGDRTLHSLRVRGRRMFRRADLERFVARGS